MWNKENDLRMTHLFSVSNSPFALQVIFKPRLVRAEWGSIEAMSGADDEDTAGGRIWMRLGETGEMSGLFRNSRSTDTAFWESLSKFFLAEL